MTNGAAAENERERENEVGRNCSDEMTRQAKIGMQLKIWKRNSRKSLKEQ